MKELLGREGEHAQFFQAEEHIMLEKNLIPLPGANPTGMARCHSQVACVVTQQNHGPRRCKDVRSGSLVKSDHSSAACVNAFQVLMKLDSGKKVANGAVGVL